MFYSVINVCVGQLVGFSVGTAITWASPEIEKLNSTLSLSEEEASWVTSLFHLGAVFSGFIFGILADKIGRKPTLLITGIPLAIAYILMALVKNLWVFYIGRFMCGISTGGLFTVMPMYIGEIADSSNRGLLAGLMNIFLCLGMLFSFCVGPYTSVLAFNLTLAIFPIAFLPAFFFLAIETPRYLMSKNQSLKAREVLQKLRGANDNIDEEIKIMEDSIQEAKGGGLGDLYRSVGNRKAFCISVVLMGFQQFSGINAIFSYAQTIFKQSNSSIPPEICSIIIGVVQLISSFLSSALIDRLGRKMLLIISGIGMVLSELPLGIYSYLKDQEGKDVSSLSILPIICLIVYILTYNVGSGTLPWTIMGELFPSNVKSLASSLTSAFCWLLGFLIVKYFGAISNSIGMGACFMIFSGFCAVSIAFTQFVVIETKGKTLEQIQEELGK